MKNPHTQLLGKTQDRSAMAGSDKEYQAGETHKARVLISQTSPAGAAHELIHLNNTFTHYSETQHCLLCCRGLDKLWKISLQKFRWRFGETRRTELVSSERWYLTGGIKVEFLGSIWKRLSIFVFSCWQPAHSKSHNNQPVYDSTHH